DEEEQTTQACGSNLELFGIAPGIEVVQASGVNVYPQCEEYRRTCAMVKTPEGQTCVVDFFRVKGGRIHQYCFHSNGSPVGVEPVSQPVEMGEAWRTWLDNPQAVSPETPGTFTWTFRDVNLDLMLLQVPDRIVLADAPGWRMVLPEELEKPPVRQILAENRAGDSDEVLDTRYAALMVPYQKNGSPVVAARLLEDDPDSGALAVEVKFVGRTDYIISTLDQQERQFGPVTVAGEFAFVSVDDQGRAIQGYLLNGTALTCGDLQITLPEANTTLKVQSVDDRTYHLAEPLSDPQVVIGSYVLVGESPRTGFEIASATQREITVRDYPAVVCDEVTVLNAGWVRVDS
ncbi:MAG: hypothetical protein ACE1ZA_10195, partial [Pseudomonadales bacterium]